MMMRGFGGGMGVGSVSGRRRTSMMEKPEFQTSPWQVAKRLAPIVAGFRRQIIIALVMVIAASSLQMLIPLSFKYTIDEVIPSGDLTMLWVIGGGLLVLEVLRYFLGYMQRVALAIAAQQLVFEMAKRLFEHVQRLSLRFYERQGTGEIISRATNDVGVLQQSISGGTVASAIRLFTMLAYAVLMLLLHWQLALIVYATVPLLLLAGLVSANMLRSRYRLVQEKMADVNSALAEDISGVRVSKAFAREDAQRRRFQSENRENLQANMSTAQVQAVATPAIQLIAMLGMGIVLLAGSWFVIGGTMTLGTLAAFVTYLIAFYQPIEQLSMVNRSIQQALAASERIFQFLDEPTEVLEKPDAHALHRVQGAVTFEHVSFAYNPGVPVLKDITIAAQPGETIALVGHTGSGKTTIANLIPRFFDPQEGRVALDGQDVRDLTLESVRRSLAMVIQETFLFGTTVRENIRYGKLDATQAEIEAAAEQAHAHEFIAKLPQGYESPVGEGGVMLSRGQRQRIALARAIIKDPAILILDEATSDVDTETEALIQDALSRVMQGRTTFVIAHRLSTIRSADQIIVLDKGEIVERGRHEELLARNGTYRALYDIQFAHQEEAAGAASPSLAPAAGG